MKTIKYMLHFFQAALITAFIILGFGCGNQNRNNNNVPVNGLAGQYVYRNGLCYHTQTNQQVDPVLCQNNNINNGQYQYSTNGQCIQTQTGLPVDPYLCQNNGLNGGGIYGGQSIQCNGVFWYYSGFGWQQIQCYGQNCSSLIVYPPNAQSQAQAIRCL